MKGQIGVIGAGTMGAGIAQVAAQAGHKVVLTDTNSEQLLKAEKQINSSLDKLVEKGKFTEAFAKEVKANLSYSIHLYEHQDATLVIEAIIENLAVKHELFKQLEQIVAPNCVLASNTSSTSITQLANATQRPSQVIGMHFMNPVPVMKLVEIINGQATNEATTEAIVTLTKTIDKIPCVVKDFPGFIANRILMPMINEAIIALSEGVSDAATIDQIMKLGMAHPMGPLQLADYIGLDVCRNIMVIMQEGFQNDKYAPSPLLVQLVSEGKLGVKTGQGFYTY